MPVFRHFLDTTHVENTWLESVSFPAVAVRKLFAEVEDVEEMKVTLRLLLGHLQKSQALKCRLTFCGWTVIPLQG